MSLSRLGAPDGSPPWGKIARLHELAGAGLAVPPGVYAPLADWAALPPAERRRRLTADPALCELIDAGPVILRSATVDEDQVGRSAAGLGSSIPDLHTVEEIAAAIDEIAASGDGEWWTHYREHAGTGPDPGEGSDRGLLIQRQIAPLALGVVAVPPGTESDERVYLECHRPGADASVFEALAAGSSPAFAGPLGTWDDPAAPRLRALVAAARQRACAKAPHGLDLEVVVDERGEVWLVQLRPLSASPWPGWPAFAEALAEDRERGVSPALEGLLVLDAEHNPAPLSPAHAGLITWLSRSQPGAGAPTVVADWLYVRTKVRDLERPVGGSSPPDPVTTLARLHREWLPEARARLEKLRGEIAVLDMEAALEAAFTAFRRMIEIYVGELVPARKDHMPSPARGWVGDGGTVLRDKATVVDVLPVTWDVASPSLTDALGANLDATALAADPQPLPDEPRAAAAQLVEWDDHLFALGLAPLRVVFVHVAERAGVATERIFGLWPDELTAFDSAGPTARSNWLDRMDERWSRVTSRARLRPPPRLWHGWPVPDAGAGPLRGFAVGDTHEGPIRVRRGLDDLLARPPAEPGAIVCLPALTAPAAVAMHSLGIRAVCTEHGGAMSHGAIMARELGLCALIGCRGCTDLPEGARARIDVVRSRLVPA